METDLHLVIRQGLWEAFPSIRELRQWPAYVRVRGSDERAYGTRLLAQLLQQALTAWRREAPRDAEAMTLLLGLDHQGRRLLNGPKGVRTRAGALFSDIGWDQFSRHYEAPLVERFAGFLQSWSPHRPADREPMTTLTFADLECTAATLYRRLERRFQPDLILTMSGPGSFAACYMMRFNPRDIPVVMATTFPRRPEQTPSERDIAAAVRTVGGMHLASSTWSVYLPAFIRHLPAGYRIALVDDRVLSGETQLLARDELTSLGYSVVCATLFANPEVRVPDLIVGHQINGPFQMPWGFASGRV